MNDWKSLYSRHLSSVVSRILDAAEECGFENVILGAGAYGPYFEDDQEPPFRTNGYFAWVCPLRGPHHFIKLTRGKRPLLIHFSPLDYWSEHVELDDPYWLDGFEVVAAPSVDAAWKALGSLSDSAFLGNETARASLAGIAVNPERLKHRLDWERSFKTAYEVECMAEANRLAAPAHRKATEVFLEGGSEFEIHRAYTGALGVLDHELPYESIVGLNEKGNILHYPNKRRDVRNGNVLLIDAGASFQGYPSDITRTRVSPRAHPVFQALVEGLDAAQREICSLVAPGLPMAELMRQTYLRIAKLLRAMSVIRGGDDAALVESGALSFFMPHGVSHLMGIFVHDVAGKQTDRSGSFRRMPKTGYTRYGRTARVLEPGLVLSVEPGIYFIASLLEDLRKMPEGDHFDWTLIGELRGVGGIRIEDDVFVTETGHRNLTRPVLPT